MNNFKAALIYLIAGLIIIVGGSYISSRLIRQNVLPPAKTSQIDYCWDEYSPYKSDKVIRHCKTKELITIYD